MHKSVKGFVMRRDELVSVAAFVLLAAFLLVGIYEGFWSLTELLSLVSYFIMAGMVGVLIWGFRQRIEKAVKTVGQKELETREIERSDSGSTPKQFELATYQELYDFASSVMNGMGMSRPDARKWALDKLLNS